MLALHRALMRTAGRGCSLVGVAHVRVTRWHPVLAGVLAVCALGCAACSTLIQHT